jgi:hypothetical protein
MLSARVRLPFPGGFRLVSDGNVTAKVTLRSGSKRHVDRACRTGCKVRTTGIGLGERQCHINAMESCRTSVAQRDGLPGADCIDNLIAERNGLGLTNKLPVIR